MIGMVGAGEIASSHSARGVWPNPRGALRLGIGRAVVRRRCRACAPICPDAERLLMNHCCAIDRMLFVSQYSTRPAGKKKNITENTSGMNHHAGLHRVGRRRVEPGPEQRRRVISSGRMNLVLARQVVDPADPGRCASHAGQQHPVQRDEERHLRHDGQAAAERVDFFSSR